MKRGMLIGVIGGGVLLVVLWYLLLFAPTSSDLNDTRDEVAAAEDQKQQLENEIRRLKELSNNQTEQEADLRALRAAIPPTPDLGAFILQANEIASASGIEWLSISPSPPAASGANSTIALSMQVEGGFYQLMDYLNRMEDMDRLVIIDAVSISTGGEEAGGGSSTGSSSDATSSSGGAPDLSVTLTGRMFTGQGAATGATGSTGGTATAGGGTTTPSTPATPSPSSTGAS
jgi:Tfp pilus assembly protein PilO